MSTFIITDRKMESLCESSYMTEPPKSPIVSPIGRLWLSSEGFKPSEVYLLGPLAFKKYGSSKEKLLLETYDRADFGTDPDKLNFYQCGSVDTVDGRLEGNFMSSMQRSNLLVPFACWYLRKGGFIAVHQWGGGWHPHYHPSIRPIVTPEGIGELQYCTLDMDGIFMFRSHGGTYEPLAHIFDELRSDRPGMKGHDVWMVPKERTDVRGLIERFGPVYDYVTVENRYPSEDGGKWRTVPLSETMELGEVEKYQLRLVDRHPSDGGLNRPVPELCVVLK